MAELALISRLREWKKARREAARISEICEALHLCPVHRTELIVVRGGDDGWGIAPIYACERCKADWAEDWERKSAALRVELEGLKGQ